MRPRVALLRGINVGGARKLPMADLRALCEGLGWREVRTFIQSGNVLFRAEGDDPALAAALEGAIARRFGYPDVPVVLRDREGLAAALASVPFDRAATDPKLLHVVFLDREPDPAAVAALDPDRSPGDAYVVFGRDVHVRYGAGAGRSKLTLDWLEARLGARGTARNLRTVEALRDALGGG